MNGWTLTSSILTILLGLYIIYRVTRKKLTTERFRENSSEKILAWTPLCDPLSSPNGCGQQPSWGNGPPSSRSYSYKITQDGNLVTSGSTQIPSVSIDTSKMASTPITASIAAVTAMGSSSPATATFYMPWLTGKPVNIVCPSGAIGNINIKNNTAQIVSTSPTIFVIDSHGQLTFSQGGSTWYLGYPGLIASNSDPSMTYWIYQNGMITDPNRKYKLAVSNSQVVVTHISANMNGTFTDSNGTDVWWTVPSNCKPNCLYNACETPDGCGGVCKCPSNLICNNNVCVYNLPVGNFYLRLKNDPSKYFYANGETGNAYVSTSKSTKLKFDNYGRLSYTYDSPILHTNLTYYLIVINTKLNIMSLRPDKSWEFKPGNYIVYDGKYYLTINKSNGSATILTSLGKPGFDYEWIFSS